MVRTALVVVALGGAMAACALGMHGCAPMPPDDCASRNRCGPSDASADQTLADAGDAVQGQEAQPDAAADASPDAPVADGGGVGDALADSGDGYDGFACDPSKSPHDEPCVIDEAYGVFVATAANGGSDTSGDGSRAKPYATIGHALAALGGKRRVYICDATYAESVTLRSATSLYGGLVCAASDGGAGWRYAEGGVAKVSAAPNEIALTLTAVDAAISVEDMWLAAADASGQDDAGNGLSSIAALVNGPSVVFRRCTLSAGAGDNGTGGATGTNYAAMTAPSGQGNDGGAGGAGGSITCSDGTSSVGGGGGSAVATGGGDGGAQPMPVVSLGFDGVGATGGATSCGLGADPGANGAAGTAGQAASTVGALTAAGWSATAGGGGRAGNPGQGGGGGGGVSLAMTGGTGGGAGGCGGAAGTGGGGGGGSIALASIGSVVVLEGCALTTAAGGNGGKGGDGQPGQGGGSPGTPMPTLGPCLGGFGGNGAGGAAGAGGTGGISACIVYRGSAPSGSPTCTHASAGQPGAAGRGGDGGDNSPTRGNPGTAGPNAANGAPGIAQDTLQSP